MVSAGAPRCPHCGADLAWGETRCPYCGASLLARASPPLDALFTGSFPRDLHTERRGWWRRRRHLFDRDLLLGVFTRQGCGRVAFLSPSGHLYEVRRRGLAGRTLLWLCAGDVAAWIERRALWRRVEYLQYGGCSYRLSVATPLSRHVVFHHEDGRLLFEIRPAGLLAPPDLVLHAPLAVELLAFVYAVTWQRTFCLISLLSRVGH